MTQDPALIDGWVWQEKRGSFRTDIGTAWDVLNAITGGLVLRSDRTIPEVLSNGCDILGPSAVREVATALSAWTHEQLRGRLPTLEGDPYHLEVYQDEPDDLGDAGEHGLPPLPRSPAQNA